MLHGKVSTMEFVHFWLYQIRLGEKAAVPSG